MPSNRLLTEREAAALLGLAVTTLRRWRWAGKHLSFFKIGNCIRYDADDITAFLEAARRSSTSDTTNAAAPDA